jgi:hypothetical protein
MGGAGRLRAVLVVASLLAAPLTAAPGRAAPLQWLAGAAAEKVTPLRFNAARDLVEYPKALCPRAIFSGRRIFDFEEPYVDRNHDGTFEYGTDLFCDANHNGRWDGLYSSGGVDHLLEWVHDDIWARAVAISDGTHTVVIETVTSQGLFIEDDDRIRTGIIRGAPGVTQVFVSSTHNESSPDPIGIYGAPDDGTGDAGLFSGVDDYYIDYLVAQSVKAGVEAVRSMQPAVMRVGEFTPPDVRARLSKTFLTTDAVKNTPTFGTPEATDDIARVVQLARASDGANIETIFNWAAHNQQIGHASDASLATDPVSGKRLRVNRAVSDDWPGMFASTLESTLGGRAMFMVGDNGSIEDPHTYPVPNGCPPPLGDEGCFELSNTTGSMLANDVASLLAGSGMETVAPHALAASTTRFLVPLQNQLFLAVFASGLFAHRPPTSATPCLDAMHVVRPCFTTEVGLLDFGPQLQMLVNPGEAYPALIEGHPFGHEQMSCPERAQPPVPAWRATADHKLEMGLGDDMIGYEIPAPGWFADPLVLVDPACPRSADFMSDPTSDNDANEEYHKLESESVGPDAGNLVASHLAALALARPRRAGQALYLGVGRFLLANGSFSRKGADGPVGVWVLASGATSFKPGAGTLIGVGGVSAFGSRPVDAHGVFIDFDGRAQSAPDIDTRGMLVTYPDGSVTRYLVDVYPTLTGSPPGAAS